MSSLTTNLRAASFRGTFRDYQQAVLERANQHLADGKIHIVAAPGSGKTILGLDLIRGLGLPTLILSPTVTIKQQWGERFAERFLPQGSSLENYMSYSLKDPRIMTSVTYQALHAASTRQLSHEPVDSDLDDVDKTTASTSSSNLNNPSQVQPAQTEPEDFRDFDLINRMKQLGIRVLCLDEAHHLRSEWYRALTAFIEAMGEGLVIIALTATPPYDANATEWARYESLCGTIDEEIFVPELVAKQTLCPHQDYVYFSYPSESERESLRRYRDQVDQFFDELKQSKLLERALVTAGVMHDFEARLDTILQNEAEFFALFRMADSFGLRLPRAVEKLVKQRNVLVKQASWRKSMAEFESALQFVIDTDELFGSEVSGELRALAASHNLVERRSLRLLADSRLSRSMISSVGKLQGIAAITTSEAASMGESLRMLILTDYIRRDLIPVIGSSTELQAIGAVPIFETVRRATTKPSGGSNPQATQNGTNPHAERPGNPQATPSDSNPQAEQAPDSLFQPLVALLTGSLVIVPNQSLEGIATIARENAASVTFKPLPTGNFSEATFTGSNKHKVAIITEAFARGLIHILIGTKALLGEGWDSPCINTLILASFVGSFMLSNQMRGRAIRVDPSAPGKSANIWHLVTLEPPAGLAAQARAQTGAGGEPDGEDWETLVRRFDCFMGPGYSRPTIESGVDRFDVIGRSFDAAGVERVNHEMMARAADRQAMANSWSNALAAVPESRRNLDEVQTLVELPKQKLPLSFTFANWLSFALLMVALMAAVVVLVSVLDVSSLISTDRLNTFISVFSVSVGVAVAVRASNFQGSRSRAFHMAEALLYCLREFGMVTSKEAKVSGTVLSFDKTITLGLQRASVKEQTVFANALREFLSPIDNPRYVLIRRQTWPIGGRYRYWQSFACPTVLGTNKQQAELLASRLGVFGKFDAVYTRSIEGRRELWQCSKRSFVNLNDHVKRKLAL